MVRLHLHVFDRLQIVDDGTRIVPTSVTTAKILGYLALHASHQHTVSRQRLVRVLWPDLEPNKGRRRLSDALYRLHQNLGERVCSSLIAKPDSETLALGEVWVDIDSFRSHVCAKTIDQWRTAIDLYSGDLLDDLHDEWLLGSRLMLRDMYCNTLARLCMALNQEGDPAAALEYAQRWITADELNEDAHALVIQLQAQLGRPTAALHQYNRLATMLDREFQSAPQPDIRAFVQHLQAKATPLKAHQRGAPPATSASHRNDGAAGSSISRRS